MKYKHRYFDLAIVGGAPAAIHELAEMAVRMRERQTGLPKTIAVLDSAVRADGGSAHSDESPAFRVNMRLDLHDIPGFMSFASFLEQFGGCDEDPPLRIDLGQYTSFVKMAACRELEARGVQIFFRRTEVQALLCEGTRYRLSMEDGSTLSAQYVILATGNAPPSRPRNVHLVDGVQDRLVYYDGSSRFARTISEGERVLIFGTGPGGLDAARHLIEVSGMTSPIHMASQNGFVSEIQSSGHPDARIMERVAETVARLKATTSGEIELGLVAKLFWSIFLESDPSIDFAVLKETPQNSLVTLAEQLAAAESGGPAWRQVLEAIGRFAPEIWALLSLKAKTEFVESWSRLYYVKRHAMPLSTARWWAAQLATGRLRIGKLGSEVTVSRSEVRARIHGNPGGARDMTFDKLVIATGPEYRLSKSRNPLIRQMLDSGLAQPYIAKNADGQEIELGGFLTRNLELAGLPGVFGMGATVRGEYFAVHSYPALARHAAIIAEAIERKSLLGREHTE